VLLGAWIENKMERDRSLVTLSAGAIGLLVTIPSTAGIHYWWELLPFGAGIVAFAVTIWTSLEIFQGNTALIQSQIAEVTERPPNLSGHDQVTRFSFLVGIIFALIAAATSALTTLQAKEREAMAKRETTEQSRQIQTPEGNVPERRSLQGIENLKPTQPAESGQSQGGDAAPSGGGGAEGAGSGQTGEGSSSSTSGNAADPK
jgi:hypothetical protein